MLHITVPPDMEGRYGLAIWLVQTVQSGRERHGAIKHLRDQRRQWRKLQAKQ
jgi:hypothetical protein